MSRIVAVHGIGQQFKGPHSLSDRWLPAIADGMALAGAAVPAAEDLAFAFYGDLFRRGGKGIGEPLYAARDVEEGFERELLEAWWQSAAALESAVPGPDDKTKVRTPDSVQRALNALSRSAFFVGLAERALIGSVKQVHRYFSEPELRALVVERVTDAIGPDTRVLVGHSLGSVVAYEAMCAHPDWPVRTLVTLGSPLGIRNLIFDRLVPAPRDGTGAWPGAAVRWTNIADTGDVVALVKELRPTFGERVVDLRVHNGAKAHDIRPYLTAKETGRALAAGLTD
ncbi:alpha/beta hydrolase [Nocardia vinacea]|uniref:alpha/beta hydrolase n=1 Tax=Nocardia vinacea TaxID=96468 RepID=UPI0002DC5C4C|nr:alpha/beta hydrolase [Nocardia vinacea]